MYDDHKRGGDGKSITYLSVCFLNIRHPVEYHL